MIKGVVVVMALAAALAAPAASWSQQPRRMGPDPKPVLEPLRAQVFACKDGSNITFQTVTRDASLVAIVQTGAALHELPLRPWNMGDPPQVAWSDGVHTLTWNPGVQLMWMDGANHRDCGRSSEHQH